MTNFWKNKKIFITGCSGFTGSWLILYLSKFTKNIYGYSLPSPFKGSLFDKPKLKKKIKFFKGDILNYDYLKKCYNKVNPDIVFHLAANPIVLDCFDNPHKSFKINALGTANLLEVIRNYNMKDNLSLNIITTDKVYKNKNTKKKFSEESELGGNDPYSMSKVSAELICETYFKSYLKNKCSLNVMRSGNIIGGGDWSKNRIIPDLVRAIKSKKHIYLRNPSHTRPWQHILDVVNNYCEICRKNYKKKKFNAWNIGPIQKKRISVIMLVKHFKKSISPNLKIRYSKSNRIEDSFLQLNQNKLKKNLKLTNHLTFNEMINYTVDWYKNNLNYKDDYKFSNTQLDKFLKKIKI